MKTLCWNCNHAYPIESATCPDCGATNANYNLTAASLELTAHCFDMLNTMNRAKVEELKHECPYCSKEMNPGCPDPSAFACCGEVGHAVEVSHE